MSTITLTFNMEPAKFVEFYQYGEIVLKMPEGPDLIRIKVRKVEITP